MKNYYVKPGDLKKKKVLIIPSGVTDIVNEISFNTEMTAGVNTSVKVIVIPRSVERISTNAFARFTGLKYVFILGNNLTEIYASAFENCRKLSYINLPDSVSYIGEKAFSNTKIKKFPSLRNCHYIGKGAFQYTSLKGTLDLSRTKVDIILENAFKGTVKLTECILPSNLMAIEDMAFACSGIKSINLSDTYLTLKFIGDYAFDCCSNLNVDLDFTRYVLLNTIGKGAFAHTRASNLKICGQRIALGEFAFEHCYYLTSIKFLNIKNLRIPSRCFFFSSLEEVSFGNIEKLDIGERCFNESAMENIEFTCVKNIFLHKKAFCRSDIKKFKINNTIQSLIVGQGCFESCVYLEEVSFLTEKLRIHKEAFLNCDSLFEVNFALTSLQTIEESAFKSCVLLETVKLPASLKCIKNDAFYNCGIKEIEFPQCLQFIGEEAFASNLIKRLDFSGLGDVTICNYAFFDNSLSEEEIYLNYFSSPRIAREAFECNISSRLCDQYPFIQWIDN